MFSDRVVEVKILDFLNQKCQYTGCKENADGLCITQNVSMRSDILEHIAECIQLNVIPSKESFWCSIAKPRNEHTCLCGSPLLYSSDNKNFDGVIISGTIRYCPNCDE